MVFLSNTYYNEEKFPKDLDFWMNGNNVNIIDSENSKIFNLFDNYDIEKIVAED